MSQHLQTIFGHRHNPTDLERAKFLSRVFGIFSEQLVAIWAAHERAPYENLGRPTLRSGEGDRGHTLDFALRDRSTGNVYVTEMKCEIEYQNFRYFVLNDVGQLDHHRKPAFDAFLKATRPTPEQTVFVGKKALVISGAILIWGAVTEKGRESVRHSKGLHAVLSIDDICHDLVSWNCSKYVALVDQRRQWCNELFSGLIERGVSALTNDPDGAAAD